METRLIALTLIMEALPLPPLVDETALPQHTHATLFLTQHFAVDLGYHFWWTKQGPMSPMLAQDIVALRVESFPLSHPPLDDTLEPHALNTLRVLQHSLDVPSDLTITQEEWIPFLAKFIFLSELSHDLLLKPHMLLCFQHPERLTWIPYAETTLQQLIRQTKHRHRALPVHHPTRPVRP